MSTIQKDNFELVKFARTLKTTEREREAVNEAELKLFQHKRKIEYEMRERKNLYLVEMENDSSISVLQFFALQLILCIR